MGCLLFEYYIVVLIPCYIVTRGHCSLYYFFGISAYFICSLFNLYVKRSKYRCCIRYITSTCSFNEVGNGSYVTVDTILSSTNVMFLVGFDPRSSRAVSQCYANGGIFKCSTFSFLYNVL